MPVPSYRVPVKIARGTYANLSANLAELQEGEIVYANDENALYVVEGGVLTKASADLTLASIGDLGDVDVTTVPPTDGQALLWDNANSEWVAGDVTTVASINDLTDVTVSGPQNLDALIYNGTSFVNKALPLAEGTAPGILMDFDGGNNSTTFTESTGKITSWTLNNTAKQSSTQTKYGVSSFAGHKNEARYITSNLLSGTSAEVAFEVGTGDFTFELWVYLPTGRTTAWQNLFQVGDATGNLSYFAASVRKEGAGAQDGITFNVGAGNDGGFTVLNQQNADLFNYDTWHHIAFCRSSGTIRSFIDGTLISTFGPSSINVGGTNIASLYFFIGRRFDSEIFDGYLDNLRFTPAAKYTTNFTPGQAVATAPLGLGSIDTLSDVDTSTAVPTNGQVLTWVSANNQWKPSTPSTVASIDDLTDVNTSAPAPTSGQVLAWNGTNWAPATASAGPRAALTDVLSYTSGSASTSGQWQYWANFGANDLYINPIDANGVNATWMFDRVAGKVTTIYHSGDSGATWTARQGTFAKGSGVSYYVFDSASGEPSISGSRLFSFIDPSTPGKLNSLSDVDTVATAPTSGSLLQWTGSKWEPKTLIARDLSEYAEYTYEAGGSPAPAAGKITNFWAAAQVDLNGVNFGAAMLAASGSYAVQVFINGVSSYTGTMSSVGNVNSNRYTFSFASTTWASGLTGGETIRLVGPLFSTSNTSEADGEVLTWNSSRSLYEPLPPAVTNAASARALLGIGEYADDTAAGAGGVASGALYYNTTNSNYVLKS